VSPLIIYLFVILLYFSRKPANFFLYNRTSEMSTKIFSSYIITSHTTLLCRAA